MSNDSSDNQIRRRHHPVLPKGSFQKKDDSIVLEQELSTPKQVNQARPKFPSPITPTLPEMHLPVGNSKFQAVLPSLISPTLPPGFGMASDDSEASLAENDLHPLDNDSTRTSKTLKNSSEVLTASKLTDEGNSKPLLEEGEVAVSSPILLDSKDVIMGVTKSSKNLVEDAHKSKKASTNSSINNMASTVNSENSNVNNGSSLNGNTSSNLKRKANVTLGDYKRLKVKNKNSSSQELITADVDKTSGSLSEKSEVNHASLKKTYMRLLNSGKMQKKECDKKGKFFEAYAVDAVLCYTVAFHLQNLSNLSRNHPATTSNWRTLPAYIQFLIKEEDKLDPCIQGLFFLLLGIAFREIFHIEVMRIRHSQLNLMRDIKESSSGLTSAKSLGDAQNLCENAVRLYSSYKHYITSMKKGSSLLTIEYISSTAPNTFNEFFVQKKANIPSPLDIDAPIGVTIRFSHNLLNEWIKKQGDVFESKLLKEDIENLQSLEESYPIAQYL